MFSSFILIHGLDYLFMFRCFKTYTVSQTILNTEENNYTRFI